MSVSYAQIDCSNTGKLSREIYYQCIFMPYYVDPILKGILDDDELCESSGDGLFEGSGYIIDGEFPARTNQDMVRTFGEMFF